jgi:Putative phage abortive infection protein
MKNRTPPDRSKVDEQSVAENFFGIAWTIVTIFLAMTAVAYKFVFPGPLSSDQAVWGQFGDFFAGILNPLISFFTLMVASKVWLLQRNISSEQQQELVVTRSEIKRQTFDQFFMSLLASHRAMTEQVTLVNVQAGATLQTGKRAIDSYITHLDGHVGSIREIYSGKTAASGALEQNGVALVRDALAAEVKKVRKVPHESAIAQFSYFFTQYYSTPLQSAAGLLLSPRPSLSFEQIFGHIFRLTYQVLEIIDEEFTDTPVLKKRYVDLLRAQMSESEFVFFALFALTSEGEKSWAMSIQLNFFKDRLKNMDWTKMLAKSFAVNEQSLEEAKKILTSE